MLIRFLNSSEVCVLSFSSSGAIALTLRHVRSWNPFNERATKDLEETYLNLKGPQRDVLSTDIHALLTQRKAVHLISSTTTTTTRDYFLSEINAKSYVRMKQ